MKRYMICTELKRYLMFDHFYQAAAVVKISNLPPPPHHPPNISGDFYIPNHPSIQTLYTKSVHPNHPSIQTIYQIIRPSKPYIPNQFIQTSYTKSSIHTNHIPNHPSIQTPYTKSVHQNLIYQIIHPYKPNHQFIQNSCIKSSIQTPYTKSSNHPNCK